MQTCPPWNSARMFPCIFGISIWRCFFLMEGCEVCKDSLCFKPMISYILWLNPSLVEPGGMFSLWFPMASPMIYVERPTGVPSRNGLSIRKPWKKSPFEPVFGSKWFSLKTSFLGEIFSRKLSTLKWHRNIIYMYQTILYTEYNDIMYLPWLLKKPMWGNVFFFVRGNSGRIC